MQEVTFPIRVMKFMGIKYLFVSNASGGMNPDFEIGDLMIQTDHINLLPNPLIGKHFPEFGDRFPDMSKSYNKSLISKALTIAKENNIKVQQGCYVGVTLLLKLQKNINISGLLEAMQLECQLFRKMIVAHQMNIPCFAISIITDLGVPVNC